MSISINIISHSTKFSGILKFLSGKVLFIWFLLLIVSCGEKKEQPQKPNVILIMADDMGYECLSSNGSLSYQTPRLDGLAAEGIRFTQCISQPLCTPSRVKIMTGKRNYRNYEFFGHLKKEEKTFGNLMKDAGYKTCIAGKWQLNGVNHKDQIPDWNDPSRPYHFGFDTYCLWQLTRERREGERYAQPLIEQNGEVLDVTEDDYGPDIFLNFILDFMEENRDSSFFIYYPMVLVHEPFVPTPDSEEWENREMRYESDTAYFRDMMSYTDKIVGRIHDKTKELGIDDNTILIFTADNGTDRQITTRTAERVVPGGKGKTIDAGVHVPLIIHWAGMQGESKIYEELIEFSDFYATFAEMTGHSDLKDGISFYGLLTGGTPTDRSSAFVHYDPHWGRFEPARFVQTVSYKLYDEGRFYNIEADPEEQSALTSTGLKEEEREIREALRRELDEAPAWERGRIGALGLK